MSDMTPAPAPEAPAQDDPGYDTANDAVDPDTQGAEGSHVEAMGPAPEEDA